MNHTIMILLAASLLPQAVLRSQEAGSGEIQRGISFIGTKVYPVEEDERILGLFAGLRVADVSDGMDMVGLPGIGLVDPGIRTTWRDKKNLTHQFRGIAVTARYVPTQRPDRPAPGQSFQEWEGNFYSAYSNEAFVKALRKGTVLVLDDVEGKDIGTIGSFNILEWNRLGAVAVVTDGGARDNDEIALEQVPLYARNVGRGIRPGRNELESVNRPVVIGGVLVCPGDIVVGDADGVIVVPRERAEDVAAFARGIYKKDKEARRHLYEKVGLPQDKTVQ